MLSCVTMVWHYKLILSLLIILTLNSVFAETTISQLTKKLPIQFKKLVKKFHPDMNSGNKNYEEKLKIITLAYTQLKKTYINKNDS